MKNKIIEKLKSNKVVVVVILTVLFSVYFLGIRPYHVRKQCSTITKFNSSYQYTNTEYNESVEKQKQNMLVDYIQCRNNNLVDGDQIYVNKEGNNPYSFTQDQYNTLSVGELVRLIYDKQNSDHLKIPQEKRLLGHYTPEQFDAYFGTTKTLEDLNQYTLGKLSPLDYHAYNGYIIDNLRYKDLKENSNKYPQCNFPDDFIQKKLWGGGGKYTTNATDSEYKTCLREHGLKEGSEKIFTPQEIRESISICKQYGGKIIYDKNGKYEDCAINGQIVD